MSQEFEEWANVPGLPDSIEVSTEGNIRITNEHYIKRIVNPRIQHGAKYFSLGKKHIRLHRAVALAFVPNPDPTVCTIVKPKDGNVFNCKANNLEWVAPKSNNKSTANKIYCVERDVVYGSIRSAAYANGIQQDMLIEALKQGKSIFGLTFRKVKKNDAELNARDPRFLEFSKLFSIADDFNSVESYNEYVRKLIEE